MLTINIRSHIVILSDGREFRITQDQYSSLLISVQDGKTNDLIKIIDPDTKQTLFHGKTGAIKEFKEIKKNTGGIRYFCDFGISHELREQCDCSDRFDINPWDFKENARRLFGKMNMQDLSMSERSMTVSHCKKRFHTV